MLLAETLSWPFFEEQHRAFADALARWADATLPGLPHGDVDEACRARVWGLGKAGFLKAWVRFEYGGSHQKLDVRTLCIARETLAFRDGLADFAFAMQGLGTGAITLYGTPELKQRYLPPVRDGKAIAAFALSEPEAGSDVAAMVTTAAPDGNAHVRIDGTKTWISNGGIADHYVVFARTDEGPGAKGLSAFVVDADTPGLSIAERIDMIEPNPLTTLKFDAVRAPVTNRLGGPGDGFKVAMATRFATEAAQRVIDRAVQLHGVRGVTKGEKVEDLYREIRALRIYEGATAVQKIVIAREALKNRPSKPALAAE